MRTCCFIGHRKIKLTKILILNIKKIVEKLIKEKNVSVFAFGSRSEFIVTDLKNEFNGIERVFLTCQSEVCTIENERKGKEEIYSKVLKREVHLQGYEKEIEHKNKYTSGRAAYIERNKALIDMSDFCVFYFDENYLPPQRKKSKRSIVSYQPHSGTALAYKYAQQKKKHIINVFGVD